MRYDLMLATVLAAPAETPAARVTSWRQLVDIVAQARGRLDTASRAAALERIAALRRDVPVDERRAAAASLAERSDSPDAVELFALDEPGVAAPVLAAAQLDAEAWLDLIARMPPASRAILRNRRDLAPEVERALASYGLTDFALPVAERDWDMPADPGTQIRDLVARIEAFRRAQPPPEIVPESDLPQVRAREFAFETAIAGEIDWVSGAPREALLGLGIGEAAQAGAFGVDGQAAGAFRRRAPFRDARLSVAGGGPASGDWLISASPVFNPRDGRFTGYHGAGRRPRPDEVASPVARLAGTALPADSLRQLIHELRTPLNAISGFAEMIERQLLGPAAAAYRGRAEAIGREAARLVELVDDLDHAARAHGPPADNGLADPQAILAAVAAHFAPTLAARGVALDIQAEAGIGVTGVAPAVLERMLTRLAGAALGLAAPGERIAIEASERGGEARIAVARPASLEGLDDATLLDPGYEAAAEHGDGPMLGLGFTLRLIANLAQGAGGRLTIAPEAFVLTLAARGMQDASGTRG